MIIVEMPEGWSLVPVEAVKVGTKLIADGGFTCLCEGEIVIVEADADGELFVRCAGSDAQGDFGKPDSDSRSDTHMLDGQLDAEGKNYIGFFLAEIDHAARREG